MSKLLPIKPHGSGCKSVGLEHQNFLLLFGIIIGVLCVGFFFFFFKSEKNFFVQPSRYGLVVGYLWYEWSHSTFALH